MDKCSICGKEFYENKGKQLSKGRCYECAKKENLDEFYSALNKLKTVNLFTSGEMNIQNISSDELLDYCVDVIKKENFETYSSLWDHDLACIKFALELYRYWNSLAEEDEYFTVDKLINRFQKLNYSLFYLGVGVFYIGKDDENDRKYIENDSDCYTESGGGSGKNFYEKYLPLNTDLNKIKSNQFAPNEWDDYLAKKHYLYNYLNDLNRSKDEKNNAISVLKYIEENKKDVSEFPSRIDELLDKYENDPSLIKSEYNFKFFDEMKIREENRASIDEYEEEEYEGALPRDFYNCYYGVYLTKEKFWIDLFADYFERYFHKLFWREEEPFKSVSAESVYERIKFSKRIWDENYSLLKEYIEKVKDETVQYENFDYYEYTHHFTIWKDDFLADYKYTFEYQRDVELLESDISEEEKRDIIARLKQYEVGARKSDKIQRTKDLINAFSFFIEPLHVCIYYFEVLAENGYKECNEYYNEANELFNDIVKLLSQPSIAYRRKLEEVSPAQLDSIEREQTKRREAVEESKKEAIDEFNRIIDFLKIGISNCETVKDLLEFKQKTQILETLFVSQEKIDEIFEVLIKKIEEMLATSDEYAQLKSSVDNSLICRKRFDKNSSVETLTTGEMLYKDYISKESSILDYSCIGLMYYRALEDVANKLLYIPYKNTVLERNREDFDINYSNYVGSNKNKYFIEISNSFKESLEIGPLAYLLKNIYTEVEYYRFLVRWTGKNVRKEDIKKLGKQLLDISNRRNEMAHGGNVVPKDKVKVARNNVYESENISIDDDMKNIKKMIFEIFDLFN